MPNLSDDEIDSLVSRAVSKAIGNRKEAQRAANRKTVDGKFRVGGETKIPHGALGGGVPRSSDKGSDSV